jgi:peptide/nickel transport system permease protein
MTRHILRRLLQAIPTLFGISIISFLLVSAVPGDPILVRTFDPKITEESRDILRRQLGLDQPLPLQYWRWLTGVSIRSDHVVAEFSNERMRCWYLTVLNTTVCDTGGGVVRGDLGTSLDSKGPVWGRMVERMPATLELGVASLLLSLLIGAPLGMLAAIRRGSWFDYLVRTSTAVIQSIPIFWIGLLLILAFAVVLNILPSGGRQTVSLDQGFDLVDRLRHLVLPALALALGGIAGFARIMRTETLEVIQSDYVRTAKAKGLPPHRVWFLHAFRNSLIPLMTILGPAIVGVLAGAVITETVFAWPGMGRLTVNAVFQKDYPLVLGSGMFFAVLTILGNLLSDIFYGWVDPRVRLS